MTTNTVPAILDGLLDPLASITDQIKTALELARQMKLPGPLIDTIKASATALDGIHDTLLDIAVTLDPTLCQDEP